MPSLDDDFAQLVDRIAAPRTTMAGGGDPIYYFAFDPAQTLDVQQRLPAWEGRMRNLGWDVERVSFGDLLWELVDERGHWDEWLDIEPGADQEDLNDAIRNVLADSDALVERVGAIVSQHRPKTAVFLTETEVLNPYFRVRTIESKIHDRVRMPTVIFYPGRRVGQHGLRFLDLYPEDSNYRATVIGGLP